MISLSFFICFATIVDVTYQKKKKKTMTILRSSKWADFDPVRSHFASRSDVDAAGFDFHLCNLPRYPLCWRRWKGKQNNSKLRISLIKRLGAQAGRGEACV